MNERASRTGGVVLVGVDGTEDSDRAIRYGVAEALRGSGAVRLVHVIHEAVPLNPMLPLFGADTLRGVGTRILTEARDRALEAARDRPLHVEEVIARGPRASAILAHAVDAALIVLGVRSSTAQRIWTGSTTTGVAARAHCPVIAVPEEWDPEAVHRCVVAAVDGSPASAEVLRAGFAAAEERHARLLVVHAWRPTGQYDAAIGGRVAAEAWQRQTEPAVWELVAGWRGDYPTVEVEVDLRYQSTVVALAEAARHADLLVMGRRGERAPFGLSLGSRARTMLRVAACPVQIVPAPAYEPAAAAGADREQGRIPRQVSGPASGQVGPDLPRRTP
ncbi:MAG: universal stress protein [Nocardioidaceae bacterium]